MLNTDWQEEKVVYRLEDCGGEEVSFVNPKQESHVSIGVVDILQLESTPEDMEHGPRIDVHAFIILRTVSNP